eukprot:CAMPEP_0114228758 /NCGR_PEP_ID=MMETSP0058-20121206/2527_1 /TAXON_ID=36894 /ORGANISM="Pyramimonas parkeae, CCMP726" /LENGTH=147 /DNA_ID=CAMNT_0001339753 /DNA_START=189 /DNA_END=632 /DNA_ORIENTATION=-
MIGLVDYGDSSDDEALRPDPPEPSCCDPASAPKQITSMSDVKSPQVSSKARPSTLPSAADLLDGMTAGSMVAEPFAPNLTPSRKRTSAGAAARAPPQPSKQQRGPVPSGNFAMRPPQLRGRSNTATVDMENMGLARGRRPLDPSKHA